MTYSILVVDDDAATKELVQEYLTDQNYQVNTASSALSSKGCRQRQIDLIKNLGLAQKQAHFLCLTFSTTDFHAQINRSCLMGK